MSNKIINVTKTFLPPVEEYEAYLKQIWDDGQVTNNGPLSKLLKQQLCSYLDLPNLLLLQNGTLALQLAIEALGIGAGDEIITTPFSYVATTSAILWQQAQPVFVDIDPDTLCIDPGKIEEKITKKTKAILPVHVFGNMCDVAKIDEIAQKHNLKVIYDAAHSFGVKYDGKSALEYGDISATSFHATKLFHTIEGGGIVCKDEAMFEQLRLKSAFGHKFDDHITLGINAKINEFESAMGLCNLKYIDEIIARRGAAKAIYDEQLRGIVGHQKLVNKLTYNNAYYPIILSSEAELLDVVNSLNADGIYPRRYFYPSLDTLPYINTNDCPISDDIAKRILCLPLYDDISLDDQKRIIGIIKKCLKK